MCITKRPCGNCPFRNDGNGITLQPGRIESIVAASLADDMVPFVCHKTLDKQRQTCAGFLALMQKIGQLPVAGRLGVGFGIITEADIDQSAKLVIGREDLNMDLIATLTEKYRARARNARRKSPPHSLLLD
ncbi:DUF6283 family protein [Comamonas sp. w2-DMI]|uniref:DUF6283 family protein n=1 Tax=Comamonas sp. w2-DMI TaxID=3126391 RepID=UPI0032E42D8B